jgi:hypothetical protein
MLKIGVQTGCPRKWLLFLHGTEAYGRLIGIQEKKYQVELEGLIPY